MRAKVPIFGVFAFFLVARSATHRAGRFPRNRQSVKYVTRSSDLHNNWSA